jgi:hypothetical protein
LYNQHVLNQFPFQKFLKKLRLHSQVSKEKDTAAAEIVKIAASNPLSKVSIQAHNFLEEFMTSASTVAASLDIPTGVDSVSPDEPNIALSESEILWSKLDSE